MIAFEVSDMTCGHCVSTITDALRSVDADAKVRIDLAARRLEVEPARASAADLSHAIREAGYTPVAVQTDVRAHDASGKRSDCCCS